MLLLGDDWALSDYAFDLDPEGASSLAGGMVEFLAGPGPADFLVVSETFPEIPFGPRGLLGTELAGWMAGQGHNWTVDPLADLTFAGLAPYSAVLLAGQVGSGAANARALHQYVLAGGSVLLMGGTGDFGSLQAEADAWAPFLSRFGLTLGPGLAAAMPGALVQVPVEMGPGVFPSEVASVVWGQGQLALVTEASNDRTSVVLQADFGGLGGGPQGPVNDIVAVYKSSFLAGDFNDDEKVDAADYTSWRDALGSPALLAGDSTPESIDNSDYDDWRTNYGRALPIESSATVLVPEPAGLLLSAVLVLTSCRYRGQTA